MKPPIYEPTGKAKEYGDLALNIYTGCPHQCYYCFAPSVTHKDRDRFHSQVSVRTGILDALRKQLETEHITDKLIHLCFTCDPYPTGSPDTAATRAAIKILKEYGNHVQILTKGDGTRDFDLLDDKDWFGVTISCMGTNAQKAEPNAVPPEVRLWELVKAKKRGINTWVSFEPVLNVNDIFDVIEVYHAYIGLAKIGKLNYHSSNINWKEFGLQISGVCEAFGVNYYIKESLREEMEK